MKPDRKTLKRTRRSKRKSCYTCKTSSIDRRPSKKDCLVRKPEKEECRVNARLVQLQAAHKKARFTVLKGKRPCTINLADRRQIVQRFRDIVNIASIAACDVIKERDKFRRQLIDAGWSYKNLELLEEIAYSKTVYSSQIPSMGKTRGDKFEWIRNRHRWER